MIEVLSFRVSNENELADIYKVREQVFINEQNVPESIVNDRFDMSAIHYLAKEDNVALGCARSRLTDEGCKLERFAVLKEHRSSGIGGLLLEASLKDALKQKNEIYLNAQDSAIRFYAVRGFIPSGDPFIVANILHQRMIYPR